MRKNILVILLIICFSLTGCNGRMSEGKIKKALEVNDGVKTFTVNKVVYAKNSININGLEMRVSGNEIMLGDETIKKDGVKFKQITGYYDQSGAMYYIYVLSDKGISKLEITNFDELNGDNLLDLNISNGTDLILIDCEEIDKNYGQTPIRYQVYTLVDDELKLLG